jgi:outer membrane protein assembly factor BamB
MDNNLYAFDASTGRLQQRVSVPSGSSPAIANGIIYIGSDDHKLYAIDIKTGQRKWVAFTRDMIYSSPMVANGVVYVGSRDYNLYAFDAATGRQKWAVMTDREIDSSPTVANGVAYIGSNDGKLYAFSLGDSLK